MATSFLPKTDAALLNWLNNANAVYTASPETYGGSIETAAAFNSAVLAYASAYSAANEVATRTKTAVAAKNDARTTAKNQARQIASIAYGQADITNEQLTNLGLTVKDTSPTPAPVPDTAPMVSADMTSAISIRVSARNVATPDRKAKPAGVGTLEIRTIVTSTSAMPSGNPLTWPTVDLVGRTTKDLFWMDQAEPATVWVSCCWVNTRNERGPFSEAVSVRLAGTGYGVQQQVQSGGGGDESMKIAA